MDLGIAGRKALVCAASKGLGRGCAEALAREGVDVTIVARTRGDASSRPPREIGAMSGRTVHWVACDITTAEGRAAALAACPNPTSSSTMRAARRRAISATGTATRGSRAIDANMLTPIELIKATIDGMIARKFGRIVNITSCAVKAPIDILGLSNGARSGLTGFVAGLARKVARDNVTINNLLPGVFDTDRFADDHGSAREGRGKTMLREGAPPRDAPSPRGASATPREFGAACAFLCSAHAGYIVGQNILIDGGGYPGTF